MITPIPRVDLRPDHWAIVRNALRRHVPDREVLAFGSRATWTAKDYSDLDLAVMGEEPLSLRTVSALDEALGESDLPFKVDVVDWSRIDDTFRAIIRRDGVSVQAPTVIPVTAARVGVPSATESTAALPSCAWRDVAIGEIADIVGGGTPSTKDARNFGGSIPWLTPRDLSGTHGRYVEHGERNLSQRGLDGSSAKLLPVRTVLLSTRAPIGYVALAKNPIATNQGFRSLVVRDGILPEFLYYWLKLNTEELERHASGSTFRELSGSALKDIRLNLPPRDGQHTIAHVLGTLDDKIELNRQMNETLEAMARALFKSWFVDFDPVRAKMEGRDTGLPQDIADLFPDRMVDSELGEVPDGWEVATLAERIEVNPRRFLRKGQAAPYLPMAKMPTRGHMPDSVAVRSFGSGMRFTNGDTLVARITPCLENGKTAYVDFLADGEIGWGSTEYIVLKPQPPLPDQFAYCLARSARFREFAIQNMSGTSGRQRVPPTALSGFLMVVPPRCLATRFGEVARSLFEGASNAGHESRTLAALRDTLLPKLISGDIRVPAEDQQPTP